MGGSSLQDQLLRLGLAKQKPKARPQVRRRPAGPAPVPEKDDSGDKISLAEAYSKRRRLESSEKARLAREKREEQERRRLANRKLTELVSPNSLNDPQAEEDRYFQHAGKIRKLFVTQEQQQGLNQGTLGIVTFKGRYHILAEALIAAVREIKPESVVFFSPDEDHGESSE